MWGGWLIRSFGNFGRSFKINISCRVGVTANVTHKFACRIYHNRWHVFYEVFWIKKSTLYVRIKISMSVYLHMVNTNFKAGRKYTWERLCVKTCNNYNMYTFIVLKNKQKLTNLLMPYIALLGKNFRMKKFHRSFQLYVLWYSMSKWRSYFNLWVVKQFLWKCVFEGILFICMQHTLSITAPDGF